MQIPGQIPGNLADFGRGRGVLFRPGPGPRSIPDNISEPAFWVFNTIFVTQSVTVAQLSSELDEERSRTSVMGSSLVDLQKTNEELCESQMNLQTKLKQR